MTTSCYSLDSKSPNRVVKAVSVIKEDGNGKYNQKHSYILVELLLLVNMDSKVEEEGDNEEYVKEVDSAFHFFFTFYLNVRKKEFFSYHFIR